MRRRLFNVIAMISLLMFGIVVLFWVRSYSKGDYVIWNSVPEYFSLGSSDGLIRFSLGWTDVDNFNTRSELLASFWPIDSGAGWDKPDLNRETFFGFGFKHWQDNYKLRAGPQKLWRSDTVAVTAPYWFLATISAILPLITLRRWIRSHRRDPFACLTCGYDLRATPDRCPECGAVPMEGGRPRPPVTRE